MKSHMNKKMVCLMLLLPSIAVFLAGCCPATSTVVPASTPVPLPETVMAGDWALTTDTPSTLPPTILTFDASGSLTSVTYTINGLPVTQTPISGGTVVSGTALSISENLNNERNSTLFFNGTLNGDNTQATGSLTTNLNINNILLVIIDGAAATLTKQQ